ncbi:MULTISPECIES: tail fiber assembly protein [Enterobacter]|uniref:Tail fiber assembly protein n=1 Tax=Enterobacter cloacae TaxID=550 RepID=A0A330G932_ENTCL|nr:MULTISPECIES: tail fiber assembly protein [Enterobacter cloacae complex]MEC5767255.1 tail fiber assembly protein [Enterobacter chengduensis]NBC78207.1 tail fiber assembly protein [Enterobacter asburiae]RAZ64269.1 tail fiber assembly protein [Enterobacter cloacae]HBM9905859.1 tail fiber assembly protein [Enterobacter chengduensis]
MLVIKCFREVEPTEDQIKLFEGSAIAPKFLRSEDGQDWYECQSKFSDDKIKIMFDNAGIVRSVVDKPVPGRGNTLAVSMFFPINMSVAEIEGTLPDGFSINGGWVFDGENVVKRIETKEELIAEAEHTKSRLMENANTQIAPLQDAFDLGIATEQEAKNLTSWKKYRVLLNRVDIINPPNIDWPERPA